MTPGNAPVTEHDRIIEKLTPRYWYAALVTCDIEVEATYTLTFLQADGSQEGVDQRGLFTLYLLMFFFWGLGSLAQAWASRWLWRARTFHPIVKLFTLSMVCWFLFVQCAMIHWAVFAGDGVGVPFLNALGHIFEIFGRVSFLLLAMLIAKGWTISSTQLTERAQLLGAVALVLVMYLVLAIWDLAGRNPATTSYTYDSAPGVIICIMHVIFMGWFAMRVSQSYQEEKHTEKRKFFMFFGALYSLWFLSLPFFAVVGAAVNAPWRERTVDILVMVANCLWYGVLGFMLWPSRATTYFEIQTDQFVASSTSHANAGQRYDVGDTCPPLTRASCLFVSCSPTV